MFALGSTYYVMIGHLITTMADAQRTKIAKKVHKPPLDSSGSPVEKDSSCIRRKKWDLIKMSYFLFLLVLPFSIFYNPFT